MDCEGGQCLIFAWKQALAIDKHRTSGSIAFVRCTLGVLVLFGSPQQCDDKCDDKSEAKNNEFYDELEKLEDFFRQEAVFIREAGMACACPICPCHDALDMAKNPNLMRLAVATDVMSPLSCKEGNPPRVCLRKAGGLKERFWLFFVFEALDISGHSTPFTAKLCHFGVIVSAVMPIPRELHTPCRRNRVLRHALTRFSILNILQNSSWSFYAHFRIISWHAPKKS